MEWWQILLASLGSCVVGIALGLLVYGATTTPGLLVPRLVGGFEQLKEIATWPFQAKDRRARRNAIAVERIVAIRLSTITDAELLVIAKRNPDRFARVLKKAETTSAAAEMFKPLGVAFGELINMFNGVADGIAAGVKEAGAVPSRLTPERVELVGEVIRSEAEREES